MQMSPGQHKTTSRPNDLIFICLEVAETLETFKILFKFYPNSDHQILATVVCMENANMIWINRKPFFEFQSISYGLKRMSPNYPRVMILIWEIKRHAL